MAGGVQSGNTWSFPAAVNPLGGGSGGSSGGGGGGGMDWLQKMMGGAGSMSWAGPAGMAGGALFGGLADLIGGPSQGEKDLEKVFSLAQNRMGQSVIDPSQYLAQYMRALAPQFNQQAEGINRRLDLDSGAAQGELARGQQSVLSGILADLSKFNAQATMNQDMGLLNLMMESAGARA